LTDLLLATDEATRAAVLDDPTALSVILIACGNTDLEVRRGALSLALAITRIDEAHLALVAAAADADAAQTAKALLTAACAPASDVTDAGTTIALQLMLALRGAEALRDELVAAQAAEQLTEQKAALGDAAPAELEEALALYTA